MADTDVLQDELDDKLPLLETVCPHCDGDGPIRGRGCRHCGGVGYIATPLGERMLALMMHHRKRLLVGNG